MLELIQKIKTYTEAGIILEHMELFSELEDIETMSCGGCKHLEGAWCPIIRNTINVKEVMYCAHYKKRED